MKWVGIARVVLAFVINLLTLRGKRKPAESLNERDLDEPASVAPRAVKRRKATS